MSAITAERSLCVVVCAAGPASHVSTLIDLAQREGWSVQVVSSPAAMAFLDTQAIAHRCGTPVRSDFRRAGTTGPRSSEADAIIVAPATYNSINKLARGINDTYALNVVAEGIGRKTRVAILPFVNTALAARRPFQHAVNTLRAEGVHVLLGPGQWQPHPPGTGQLHLSAFPWQRALAAVGAARS